ncbi:MAG TPA: pseudaminic acid synthase [Verrucomicrobiae bacterium]|nr:pseudaminic acid synthase [Verrucomicrobiae bacterium]
MQSSIEIAGRRIETGLPCYVIAELSANHNQSLAEALELIRLAKDCGADAVKIQTYTPDTLTLDCDDEYFRIGKGTIWEGKNLYQLYGEAFTPWEWHADLFAHAKETGITLFSTPFDETAVDLLEKLGAPAYKIASFELVHLPLIRRVARTGKPMIMSTGMGSRDEIGEAVAAAREAGCRELALLKCTSAYPAPPEEANLRTIPHLANEFGVPAGLSDHTMGSAVAVASACLGGCIIEKHFTRSRAVPGPDSVFSMEPAEFKSMVADIRTAEKALGRVGFELTAGEQASRIFRRSIFVVQDIPSGGPITPENVRIIRPGHGLAPRHWEAVLGKKAKRALRRGKPLNEEDLQ